MGSLSSHLRNLVVAKTGGLEPLLELPDSLKKLYQEQASHCSHQFLYEALGITTACETGYKAAVNPRLHIEFTLMRLSYLMGKPSDKPVVAAAPAPEVKPVPVSEVKPEVKPAPAPEVKPAPQAEAPARRRTPKTGSALSMSALMEEKKEEEAPVEAAPQNQALPEDEVVRLKWKELAGQYSSKPRLQSMLQSGNIQLSEENGTKLVEFFVTNEAQKQWVEEKMLRELENKLRELVTCTKVNVLVSVTPMEEIEKVPYMPEEKAKDLMEKNPEVRAFVADMGLDTK